MKLICETCKAIWQRAKNGLKEYHFLLKPTVILAAVYLVAMSAILRANFYYDDDIARALWGYAGWENYSRYLSVFFSGFLHADSYLTDISPLPQILAAFITALASIMVIYLITGERKITFWHLVAVIPMGLSPYFLECLSFKYDAPYMALSVLFSVVPLLFCGGNQIAYCLLAVCGTVCMCTTYQASSGIFPMLVLLMGMIRWIKGEKITQVLKFFAVSAAGYVLGMLLFRVFLMNEIVAYASSTVPSLSELPHCVLSNYKKFIVNFLRDFKVEWLILILIICAYFLYAVVSGSKQNKLCTLLLTAAAMLGLFLLSFGAYPFLTTPIFAPRSMYGIGCLVAFLGIYAISAAPKGYPGKAACLILSWAFFVFSFTYGNSLSVQAQYTDFRITEVIDDLLECETLSSGEDVTLQITGTIGYAPVLENMLEEFPVIKKLVPVTFQGDGWWGEYGLRNYYCLPQMQFAPTYDPPEFEMPVIVDNYYHTIRANETYIWIDLH
ncbi:MAG: glucosyltransferase domain-containing protein [Faecousia sp.]